MANIHLLSPDGNNVEQPEDEVRTLWQEGKLQGEYFCWKEGMKDWTPLPFYFSSATIGPAAHAPHSPPKTPGRRYRFKKDPRVISFILFVMLWLSIGFEIITLIGHYQLFSVLGTGVFTQEQIAANQQWQGVIAIGFLVVFLVTALVFLKWIYRANLNSHCFGTRDMKFSPGWSIGWYFIPFMNLFKPYQAMVEIWKVSQNPQRWESQKSTLLLPLWWTLWLATGISGQIASRLSLGAESPDDLKMSSLVSIGAGIISIALCLAAILLVRKILKQQMTLTSG